LGDCAAFIKKRRKTDMRWLLTFLLPTTAACLLDHDPAPQTPLYGFTGTYLSTSSTLESGECPTYAVPTLPTHSPGTIEIVDNADGTMTWNRRFAGTLTPGGAFYLHISSEDNPEILQGEAQGTTNGVFVDGAGSVDYTTGDPPCHMDSKFYGRRLVADDYARCCRCLADLGDIHEPVDSCLENLAPDQDPRTLSNTDAYSVDCPGMCWFRR
jgi:hypothetical protein